MIDRRKVLAGLAGVGAAASLPALAQSIGRQSDPYAQIDPYADPRNGFAAPQDKATGAVLSPRPSGLGPAGHLTAADEEEIAIGRSAYPKWIQDAGGPHPDPRLQQALTAFCKPIFAVADRANLPWVVTLTNAPFPNINASAGHGGHVIVHTGMIQIFDRPEYLAAVLGHEVGHVDLHHGVRGVQLQTLIEGLREQGISLLDKPTLGALLPATTGRVKDDLDLIDKAFSREDEAEADAHAVVILDRLGIDPRLAAEGKRVFLKLEQMLGLGGTSEWVRTHPLTPDRIRHMEQRAALLPKPTGAFQFAGWDVLKAAFPTVPAAKKV